MNGSFDGSFDSSTFVSVVDSILCSCVDSTASFPINSFSGAAFGSSTLCSSTEACCRGSAWTLEGSLGEATFGCLLDLWRIRVSK